jgi:hypothetical protein
MSKRLILGWGIVLLLLTANAHSLRTEGTVAEASAVARLVGNTPYDIINQLDTKQLNLNHATQLVNRLPYMEDLTNTYPITEGFPGNYNVIGDVSSGLSSLFWATALYDAITKGWAGYSDMQKQLNKFKANELFVLETRSDPSDFSIYTATLSGITKLYPKDVQSWRKKFSETNPLFFLNIEGAGLALPHQQNYVNELTRYSTIISPKDVKSSELTTAILCNLHDNEMIGDVYRRSRSKYCA